MEYRKPTISVLAKAIRAIEGSNIAAKGSSFLDGESNPGGPGSQGYHNNVAAAYEADE